MLAECTSSPLPLPCQFVPAGALFCTWTAPLHLIISTSGSVNALLVLICFSRLLLCIVQEELEAYDRHQRILEDNLDSKTAELIGLRRAALEAAAAGVQQVRTAVMAGSFPFAVQGLLSMRCCFKIAARLY
jgi:hypothetical protein